MTLPLYIYSVFWRLAPLCPASKQALAPCLNRYTLYTHPYSPSGSLRSTTENQMASLTDGGCIIPYTTTEELFNKYLVFNCTDYMVETARLQ